MRSFPSELLTSVISNLATYSDDLQALSLTCKRFRSIAQPLLFKNPTVYLDQPKKVNALIRTIRKSQELAKCVEELQLFAVPDFLQLPAQDPYRSFYKLATALSKQGGSIASLTIVEMRSRPGAHQYWKSAILKANPDFTCFRDLSKLVLSTVRQSDLIYHIWKAASNLQFLFLSTSCLDGHLGKTIPEHSTSLRYLRLVESPLEHLQDIVRGCGQTLEILVLKNLWDGDVETMSPMPKLKKLEYETQSTESPFDVAESRQFCEMLFEAAPNIIDTSLPAWMIHDFALQKASFFQRLERLEINDFAESDYIEGSVTLPTATYISDLDNLRTFAVQQLPSAKVLAAWLHLLPTSIIRLEFALCGGMEDYQENFKRIAIANGPLFRFKKLTNIHVRLFNFGNEGDGFNSGEETVGLWGVPRRSKKPKKADKVKLVFPKECVCTIEEDAEMGWGPSI